MAEIARLAELLILAGLADRHVHVGAQVALFHVTVAGAQRDDDCAQLLHVSGGLGGRADIRLGDDLHQRHARAVEVHIGRVRIHVVDRLARVLFQVQALDAAGEGIILFARHFDIDLDLAFAHDGVGKLADLIALREVGIEIVLPVEPAVGVDLCLQAKTGADGLLHAEPVDHRQHARHRCVHQGDIAVGVGTKGGRRAREQLGVGRHLRMDFEPHDDFPVASVAFDAEGGALGHRFSRDFQWFLAPF